MKKILTLITLCFSLSSFSQCREMDGTDYWWGKSKGKTMKIAADLSREDANYRCKEANGIPTKIIKTKSLGCEKDCSRATLEYCNRWEWVCESKAIISCCPKF